MKYEINVPLVVEAKDQNEAFKIAVKIQSATLVQHDEIYEDDTLDIPEPVRYEE